MKNQTTPSTGNSTGNTAHDITTEPTRTGITQSFRHFYASNGITLDAERLSTCHIALAGIRMLTEVLNKNQLDDQDGDGGIELNVRNRLVPLTHFQFSVKIRPTLTQALYAPHHTKTHGKPE